MKKLLLIKVLLILFCLDGYAMFNDCIDAVSPVIMVGYGQPSSDNNATIALRNQDEYRPLLMEY